MSDNSHDDNSTVIRKEQIQLSETKFTGKEHVDSPFSANQRYDHVDSEMTINEESRSYNPHHPESDNGSISTATWKSKSGPGQYGPCSSTPLRQAPMDKENPLQPLQALEHVAESTNLSPLSDHSPILPSLSSSSSSSSHASGNGGGTQGACDNLSLVLGGTAAAADVDSTESIRTKVDGILARYGGRVHGSHVGDEDDNDDDDDDDDDGRYQVRASDPLHSLPSDVTHTSFQRHQISSTNIMQGKDNNNKMFAFSESDDDGLIAENSGSLEAMAWDGRDFDGYSIENNGKVSLHDAKPTEVDSTDGLEVDNEMSPNVQQLVDMIAAHRVGNDEDDEDSLSVISERTEPESDISIDSDVHLSVADFPDNNTTGEHKYTTGDDMIKANYDKVVDELNHRGEDMAKPRQGDIGAVKSTGKTLKKQAHVSDSAKIDSPLFASLDTLALEQSKHQPDEPDEDLDVLLLRNQAYEDEIPVPVLPHCTIDEPVEVVGATLGARNPNTGQMSQTRDMETTQPDLTSQDSLDISIGNQNPQVIDSDLDLDAPLGQNPDQDDAETETIPEEKFSETNTNTSLPEQEGDEKVDEVSTPASTENVHPTESVIRETSLGNGFPYEEPQNDSEVAKVSPMEDVNAGVKRSALIRQDTLDILAGNQKGYIQASDLDGDLEELLAGNPDLEGTESVPCHIAEEKNPETDKKNSPSGLEEEGEEIVVLREAPSKHSALEEFIVVKSNSEDQIFSDGIYLDTNNGKLLPRRESITPNEEYVMIVEENVTEFTSPPTVTESTSPPTVTESTSPPTVTVDESAVTSSEESLNLVVPTNITSGEVIDLQMEEAITQLDAKSKVSMGLIYEDIDDDSVAESCSSDTIAPEGSGSSLPEADMMTAEGDTTDGQNIPATDTSVSGSSPRPHDDRMSRGSGSSEREDNIEEMFAAHAHKNNLLSPHSISRESLASYYSDAGEANYGKIPVSGDILFGLNYNYKISTMEISVKECRDLAPVDTKKNRSDPYVKTYLLPDKSKSGKRKTRVRKNSLNPTFNEVLKYQVTKSELQTRTLWITVWNNDVLGRNDFLGEVTISLEYYHFTSSEPKWYKLQERLQVSSCTTLTYKGEIQLSLKYITPENVQFVKGKSKKVPNKGELHALISGCQNLTAVRSNGSSNPFCKGYLLPDKSSKVKTPVIKHTCNPTWKHTFMFDGVSAEDLGQFCLELTVWDHDRLTSNDFLGGVRIGLGSGFSKDKEVDWMDSEGREIELWQNMMDRPNFWVEGTLPLRSNMTPVKK